MACRIIFSNNELNIVTKKYSVAKNTISVLLKLNQNFSVEFVDDSIPETPVPCFMNEGELDG